MGPKPTEIKEDLSANFIMAMETSFARGKAKSNSSFIGMTCYKVYIQKKKTPSVLFKNEN